MSNKTLEQYLKTLRKACNYSQEFVASHLNITRQTYSHYETGQRQPTQEALIKLSNIFGVTVDYLLGISDSSSSLDKELEGVDFALFGEVKDLTDAEKEDVLSFIKFTKSKRNDNNGAPSVIPRKEQNFRLVAEEEKSTPPLKIKNKKSPRT